MRQYMNEITYIWTDGSNKDFERFYKITEEYYSQLAGGTHNREGFVPYNIIMDVKNVLIAYRNNIAIGCVSFKDYSKTDADFFGFGEHIIFQFEFDQFQRTQQVCGLEKPSRLLFSLQ